LKEGWSGNLLPPPISLSAGNSAMIRSRFHLANGSRNVFFFFLSGLVVGVDDLPLFSDIPAGAAALSNAFSGLRFPGRARFFPSFGRGSTGSFPVPSFLSISDWIAYTAALFFFGKLLSFLTKKKI